MKRGGKRQGAGRKPAPPKRAITVRLSEYSASRFRLYCHITKLSQSRAIERLIGDAKI
jgi:hypothetical protein